MEWSGRPLTEELCVAILRHLEPRHLAAVSACSSTARRAAASDALWEPLFVAEHEEKRAAARPRQRGAAAAAGTSSGAPPLSDEQRQRRRNAVAVGVFKEKYRKGRADELRQQVWTARQKAASAEAAHSNSLQNCEELDRAVHRLRGAVASEQRAKRQRLAHGGWHPSAVSRQLTGGGADFDLGAAKAGAADGADGPPARSRRKGTNPRHVSEMDGSSTIGTAAEQTLRRFEAQSAERRVQRPPYHHPVSRHHLATVSSFCCSRSRVSVWVCARGWVRVCVGKISGKQLRRLGRRQAALAVLEAKWARSQRTRNGRWRLIAQT
jgi:hypothetical protein